MDKNIKTAPITNQKTCEFCTFLMKELANNMATIKFYLNKNSTKEDGTCPLKLSIIHKVSSKNSEI